MDQNNPTNDFMEQVQESVPDSIHPLLNFLLENGKVIITAIVAIIIIASGYAFIQHSNQKSLEQAQNKLGTIMLQTNGADQIKALTDFQSEAPSELDAALDLSLAKAYMDASQFDKAAEAWKKVATKNDAFASIAALGQAKSLILGDKPEEAITILQKLQSEKGETYKATTSRLLASAAVMAGKNDLAIQAYQSLMSDNPTERSYYESRVAELKAKN